MPPLQNILEIAIPATVFFLSLVVGMDLTVNDFSRVTASTRSFLVGTLSQYLLPFVALLTLALIKPGSEITAGMILLASAPGGGISNYYTYVARANVALSVVLTAFSCVVAALTMPLLLALFQAILTQRVDFNVPLKLLFGQLVVVLVFPVVLGVSIRRRFEFFVVRYEKIFRGLSFMALAALIGFTLYQTSDLFFIEWKEITLTATVFIALSMALGYLIGALFRLVRNDAFTIMIELGVRNVAIATTTAVVLLKKTEFATFAATYFVIEAILILSTIFIFRRKK